MNYKFSAEDKLCSFILNRALSFSSRIKIILVKNDNNNISVFLTDYYINLIKNLKPEIKFKKIKKIKKRKNKKSLYWIPSLKKEQIYGNILYGLSFQQAYNLSKYIILNNNSKE